MLMLLKLLTVLNGLAGRQLRRPDYGHRRLTSDRSRAHVVRCAPLLTGVLI
jgi:hypothetical protein